MATVDRFEDLLGLESHDMPYMFDTMFSAEGRRARSSSRKRFKTLKTIDSDLREVLHEDEKVYFLAKGEVNSALDNLLFFFFEGRTIRPFAESTRGLAHDKAHTAPPDRPERQAH